MKTPIEGTPRPEWHLGKLRLGNFLLSVSELGHLRHYSIVENVASWDGTTTEVYVDFKMTNGSQEALQEMALASLASVIERRRAALQDLSVLLEVCR